jgi:hypothetical protein
MAGARLCQRLDARANDALDAMEAEAEDLGLYE